MLCNYNKIIILLCEISENYSFKILKSTVSYYSFNNSIKTNKNQSI